MSVGAIGGNAPVNTAQRPEQGQEITTVTTKCPKKHEHDRSCPHTVSTRPAPKEGEDGYNLDKTV